MVTAKGTKSISRKGRRERKEFNQIDFCPQIARINSDFCSLARGFCPLITQISLIFARWLAFFNQARLCRLLAKIWVQPNLHFAGAII